MKLRFIAGTMLVALSIPLFFAGCKDDEPKPAGISFENTSETTSESDGTVKSFHPTVWRDLTGETGATGRLYEVRLKLDKAASNDAVIAYTIGGTATRNTATDADDYAIEGMVSGATQQLNIEKGATEVVIPITLYEDIEFELTDQDSIFETIELNLTSVVSGPVKLGENTSYKLKINEDDLLFILQWADGVTGEPGDVDMDLLFSLGGDLVWGSINGVNYEAVNFPGGFAPGSYGISYTYYSGASDDLDFAVAIFTTGGTLNGNSYPLLGEEPLLFQGHYTQVNINEWSEASPPKVAHSMTKTGINYTGLSDLAEFSSGSRMGQSRLKLDKDLISKVSSIKALKNYRK